MAGQSRTLKLSILGDIDQLKKSLDKGTKEVQTFGSKLTEFGKKAGLAFAAAGAAAAVYAGKLLVDGVKAAIADEKANALLANTLRNVAGATDETIKKTLAYTRATELATGVTEDELRPSLNRLSIATGDVQKAMQLQTLALNISAGSGKSLETVTTALAKAQEGNTVALGKLGVGLSAASLKTLSMDEITKKLADTFEGASAVAAETYEVKMQRLGLAFEDVRDTIGGFILDAITPMVTIFVQKVMPQLAKMADSIGKDLRDPLNAVKDILTGFVIPAFRAFYNYLADFVVPFFANIFGPALTGLRNAFSSISTAISNNEADLQPLFNLFKLVASFARDNLGPAIGTVLRVAFEVVGSAISGVITSVSRLINFFDDAIDKIRQFINLVKNNPLVQGLGSVIDRIFGGGRAAGGPVSAGTTYLVGERGPELFTPSGSGSIIPNHRLGGGGSGINITVNGAIDPESVARQIITILNNSSYRGTLGAGALV
jgi:hypothetical protein